MKIELNTTNKTISIQEDIILDELVKGLSKILPNGLWKEFTLKTNTVINWVNPIYVPYVEPVQTPNYPWITYTNGTSSGDYVINTTLNTTSDTIEVGTSVTYCIDLQVNG